MKLKAFKLAQGRQSLYLTVIPAKELMAYAKTDVWDSQTDGGYQRKISQTRANKAGRYLLKGGMFPQSIVLNVRGPMFFTEKEDYGTANYGELEIPPESMPLWEIDGQHRIGGLEYAIKQNPEYSNFPVNTTILTVDLYEEMKQFYTINTEMKGIRADLAERLISEMVKREGENEYRKHGKVKELLIARATKITDILNKTLGQPWQNAIQLPNEDKKQNHLIAQRSLVVSLKPVLRVTEGLDPETTAKILINYWKAIRELYPKAFENPEDYLIQKTLGVFVFHMLFPRIYSLGGGDYTQEKLRKTLTKIKDESPQSAWHKEGEYKPYGGTKGFNYLATTLEEYLEQETPKIKL
jgi:DGQHR domain-containing protein